MGSLCLQGFTIPLLQALDLQLNAAECISLSGPSGSGKTLLLRAIADLDPHLGEARVNSTPQQALSGPAWRRQVALLPAEGFWWHDRVAEHFQQYEEIAFSALGLGPETTGWQVSRLSSGEKQRLALARLLQNHPQVILLDEPTANLDRGNTLRVEALIGHWRKTQGCAVIWASHDREQLQRVAGRHLIIEAGKVVEHTPWN